MTDLSPVTSGDYLAGLQATRDAIVADLGECESMRDKAALYNRLESVMKLIKEATPIQPKGDVVDEIAQRRTARRSVSPKDQARAKRPG